MKVIDLLNKIANGEIELGTKFNWHYKLYDIELIFTERQGALGLYFQREDRLIGLFERFNYQILNDEVEIIEDKKIEKLYVRGRANDFLIGKSEHMCYGTESYVNKTIADKINEIIDVINRGD